MRGREKAHICLKVKSLPLFFFFTLGKFGVGTRGSGREREKKKEKGNHGREIKAEEVNIRKKNYGFRIGSEFKLRKWKEGRKEGRKGQQREGNGKGKEGRRKNQAGKEGRVKWKEE